MSRVIRLPRNRLTRFAEVNRGFWVSGRHLVTKSKLGGKLRRILTGRLREFLDSESELRIRRLLLVLGRLRRLRHVALRMPKLAIPEGKLLRCHHAGREGCRQCSQKSSNILFLDDSHQELWSELVRDLFAEPQGHCRLEDVLSDRLAEPLPDPVDQLSQQALSRATVSLGAELGFHRRPGNTQESGDHLAIATVKHLFEDVSAALCRVMVN